MKKPASKTKKDPAAVESRITREPKKAVQTAPVTRKSKEDAAEDLVKLILPCSDKLGANIAKSGKGKCVVVDIAGCEGLEKLTCLVFNGSGITVIAEADPTTAVFNVSKRNYDSVENAAKYIRCAFVKDKPAVALKVPVKVSSKRFS